MNWEKFLDCFELNNDGIFHKQVQLQFRIDQISLIIDRNGNLLKNVKTLLFQFKNKAFFIDAFQKTGTKSFVNRYRTARYQIRQFGHG
jgi:hypothetical protein